MFEIAAIFLVACSFYQFIEQSKSVKWIAALCGVVIFYLAILCFEWLIEQLIPALSGEIIYEVGVLVLAVSTCFIILLAVRRFTKTLDLQGE